MAKVGTPPVVTLIACVAAATFVYRSLFSISDSRRDSDGSRDDDHQRSAIQGHHPLETPRSSNLANQFSSADAQLQCPDRAQQTINNLTTRNTELEAIVAALTEENTTLTARLAKYRNKKNERRQVLKQELEATVASLSEENGQLLVTRLAEEKQRKNERRSTRKRSPAHAIPKNGSGEEVAQEASSSS